MPLYEGLTTFLVGGGEKLGCVDCSDNWELFASNAYNNKASNYNCQCCKYCGILYFYWTLNSANLSFLWDLI